MSKGDAAVKVAKITAIGVVLAALIGASGVIISSALKPKEQVKSGLVPPNLNVRQVPKLNDETTASEVETLRDVSMWDLREWRLVPVGENNPRFSPANYINYLHVKKLKPVKFYRAHYATNGSTIDLRCITHSAEVLSKTSANDHPGEEKVEYEVDVDISDVPLNHEFLIVIEATYWNSFQNLTDDDVETYTDEDMQQMDELAVFVLLPEGKPFKSAQRWDRETKSTQRVEFIGSEKFFEDKDGRFLYWSIGDRKPDHHYIISWKW